VHNKTFGEGADAWFRGLAPIAAVIPARIRGDSEHAVDAANDPTGRSANNSANQATDRSEHAQPSGIPQTRLQGDSTIPQS
jgi:hypothetical protein